jgi:hypothetical protein
MSGRILTKTVQCEGCKKTTTHELSRFCGAWVCDECDWHEGLCRCFCGWTANGSGNGRQELEEMGETIEEDY